MEPTFTSAADFSVSSSFQTAQALHPPFVNPEMSTGVGRADCVGVGVIAWVGVGVSVGAELGEICGVTVAVISSEPGRLPVHPHSEKTARHNTKSGRSTLQGVRPLDASAGMRRVVMAQNFFCIDPPPTRKEWPESHSCQVRVVRNYSSSAGLCSSQYFWKAS